MRNPAILLLVAAALALSGCGYRPLYGSSAESAGVAATMASVAIPEARTRVGQLIRNDLIATMRSGEGAERYTLNLMPEAQTTGVISKSQPAVTRQSVNLSVAYELVDQRTGQMVHKGRTFAQASFDVVRQPFADMQAETNATERAAHEVSADIRTRIAAYFSSNPPTP